MGVGTHVVPVTGAAIDTYNTASCVLPNPLGAELPLPACPPCSNCRGFWSADVLNGIGLPPDSSEREAHKRWWWMAHNMASEHSAATRGGHPW